MPNSTGKENSESSSARLNIHAPVFKPKNGSKPMEKIGEVSSFNLQKGGNIKSTILVPPQRTQLANPMNTTYTYATYYCPTQYPVKIDNAHQLPVDGSVPYVVNPYYDPNIIHTPIFVTPLNQNNNDSKSFKPSTSNNSVTVPDQNGAINPQTIHVQSVTGDRPTTTVASSVSQSPLGDQSMYIYQNNRNPVVIQTCSQPSTPFAFVPAFYPSLNNIYFRPQSMYTNLSTYAVSQNKSATKINIREKVFSTGDLQLDKILNELVKSINPIDEFVFHSKNSRFFVIKSFTEDNIYQSIKHGAWCSTPAGNETLQSAYRDIKSKEKLNNRSTEAHVYLFFSVNGSGYFCGVAEMMSEFKFESQSIWNQKKWQGSFKVKWLYIKDVPNSYLRHIKLENNDNRPVTNSRDATEILPLEKGVEVLRIIHNIDYDTCLLNDFDQISMKTDKS